MPEPIRCSVLLAACCGERFLAAQLDSILPQLGPQDELLVSDDSPADRPETREIAERYVGQDPRVKVLRGPERGVIRNVEFLLTRARGAYLLLSDQDDVWLPGKLEKLCAALDTGALAAIHDAILTDGALQPLTGDDGEVMTLFAARQAGPGLWRNIARNGYTGCCMAIRRELLADALPFPPGIPMHDQWLGLAAERRKDGRRVGVAWLREPLLLHRRHEGAQTARGGSFAQKLRWRVGIIFALLRHAR